MAALDLQEQEQLDAIKAWWKDNGTFMILSVVILIGGVFGVEYWKAHKANQAAGAVTLYAAVNRQVASKDVQRVNDAAQAVVDKYGSSPYAALSELTAAQVSIDAKDAAQAQTQLQWVISNAKEDAVKNVARLKLASVLIDEKKYDEAMAQLSAAHPPSFDGLYADMKGDILLAQGKSAEARAAYQEAFNKLESKSTYRNLVQMKLDSVGGAK